MCIIRCSNIALAIVAMGCVLTTSCSKDDLTTEENKELNHVGMYSFSNDLLEIYDVKVEAVCDSTVVGTYNLKDTKAYYEDDEKTSYDISFASPVPVVEYKLTLTCCKKEEDLGLTRSYDLGLDALFTSVTYSPESILTMMADASEPSSQIFDGKLLQSFYYDKSSKYCGKTVYEVYAQVNSTSFVVGDTKTY